METTLRSAGGARVLQNMSAIAGAGPAVLGEHVVIDLERQLCAERLRIPA